MVGHCLNTFSNQLDRDISDNLLVFVFSGFISKERLSLLIDILHVSEYPSLRLFRSNQDYKYH